MKEKDDININMSKEKKKRILTSLIIGLMFYLGGLLGFYLGYVEFYQEPPLDYNDLSDYQISPHQPFFIDDTNTIIFNNITEAIHNDTD
jgi:hypothetical protein